MKTPNLSLRIGPVACAIVLVTSACVIAAPRAARAQTPPVPTPAPQTQVPVPEDVTAPPASAKKTPSGLAYRVLQKGTGKQHPGPADRVKVHYSGWTTDGKMFDSSVVRGEPLTRSLAGLIPGWTEGVQLMVIGEKTRFWIPEALAYKGQPGRPAGMLVFDIELLGIK